MHGWKLTYAFALIFVTGTCCASDNGRHSPVRIRLSPVAEVRSAEVRLSDVARLPDNDRAASDLIKRIADVDLLLLSKTETMAVLNKSQIGLRLRLDGLTQSDYQLIGPEQIIVSLTKSPFRFASSDETPVALVSHHPDETSDSGAFSDLAVERAVQSSLEQQFHLKPDEVGARLLRPFVDRRNTSYTGQNLRIEVLPPARFPYGRTNMIVRVWDGGKLVTSGLTSVDVRRKQKMVVARRRISSREKITPEAVKEEIRYTDKPCDELTVGEVVGMTCSRSLSVGDVVCQTHLIRGAPKAREPVISTRDSVRIIAVRDGHRFEVPSAEALQPGAPGQSIRVRNLHTNKIVSARVVGKGLVEIPL